MWAYSESQEEHVGAVDSDRREDLVISTLNVLRTVVDPVQRRHQQRVPQRIQTSMCLLLPLHDGSGEFLVEMSVERSVIVCRAELQRILVIGHAVHRAGATLSDRFD